MPGRIKKLLLDLDGTLLQGTEPAKGSPVFMRELNSRGIDFLIMTNSIKSPGEISKRLARAGMEVEEDRILNPVCAINSYLSAKGIERVYTAGSSMERDQVNARQDEDNPEMVLLLDFEKDDTPYSELQRVFSLLQKGVPAVAASGSPNYQKSGIRYLDTGAFVRLFESAAGISIPVFGKPSPSYFSEALKVLSAESEEILVVGDDWQTDIKGAVASGMESLLVRSGKYREGDEKRIPGTVCIDDLSGVFRYLD